MAVPAHDHHPHLSPRPQGLRVGAGAGSRRWRFAAVGGRGREGGPLGRRDGTRVRNDADLSSVFFLLFSRYMLFLGDYGVRPRLVTAFCTKTLVYEAKMAIKADAFIDH